MWKTVAMVGWVCVAFVAGVVSANCCPVIQGLFGKPLCGCALKHKPTDLIKQIKDLKPEEFDELIQKFLDQAEKK